MAVKQTIITQYFDALQSGDAGLIAKLYADQTTFEVYEGDTFFETSDLGKIIGWYGSKLNNGWRGMEIAPPQGSDNTFSISLTLTDGRILRTRHTVKFDTDDGLITYHSMVIAGGFETNNTNELIEKPRPPVSLDDLEAEIERLIPTSRTGKVSPAQPDKPVEVGEIRHIIDTLGEEALSEMGVAPPKPAARTTQKPTTAQPAQKPERPPKSTDKPTQKPVSEPAPDVTPEPEPMSSAISQKSAAEPSPPPPAKPPEPEEPTLPPALLDPLSDESSTVRQNSAELLGEIGNPAAITPLAQLLRNDPDSGVRAKSAEALGKIVEFLGETEHRIATPALLRALDDSDGEVRRHAVGALGITGNKDAVPALLELLNDPDIEVRKSVVETLEQMGHIVAMPMMEYMATFAANDTVEGVRDALDYQKYIDAFVDLIRDEYTQPPLNIGVYGSWGTGKTFLKSKIRDALRDTPEGKLPTGRLRRFFRWLRVRLFGPPKNLVRVVEFNAWEYHTHDVIWAGLVSGLIDQLERESSLLQRSWQRVRRNLQRQWQALSWRRVPLTLFLAIFIGVTVYLAWDSLDVTRQLFSDATGQLFTAIGGLAGLLALLQNILNAPLSRWITRLFSGSDYGQQIGYMPEIKADIEALRRTLPKNSKIVIMIDDLDRCPPDKSVDVLEAVKLLLDFDIFIVFLFIDARMVTRAVEKHYEGILTEAGASGYEYLDKVIQIPFTIPEPNEDDVRNFLNHQFGLPGGEPVEDDPPRQSQPPEDMGEEPVPDGSEPALDTSPGDHPLTEHHPPAPQTAPPPDDEESRMVGFDKDTRIAFRSYANYLEPNPRHIKRLLNTYRLVRLLAADDPLMLENPRYLVKWLLLSSQWPFTMRRLLYGYDLWQSKQESPNAPGPNDLLTRLYRDRMGDPDTPGDLPHLPDAIRSKRAQLDADNLDFLRLIAEPDTPINAYWLRRLRRYTMSFHPALDEAAAALITADMD